MRLEIGSVHTITAGLPLKFLNFDGVLQRLHSIIQASCRVCFKEGPEGVKWELGLAGFCPGKMGFKPLGLGFGHWEWE